MGLREEIQKKIDKKQAELEDFVQRAHECEIYIASLQEVVRMLPRVAQEGKEALLRPGSQVARARDVLRQAGKPLHVSELLQAMGRGNSKQNRLGLSGSLASYVRRSEIFTRPEPNTFGLTEFDQDATSGLEVVAEDSGSLEGSAKVKAAS